jgi:enoyl-CoA hydratase
MTMSSAPDLKVSVRDGIGHVEISNPARRNAFTVSMWRSLADTMKRLEADSGVRVIALCGAGEHFSSGADISEFGDQRSTLDQALAYQALVDDANAAVAACLKPVVALIKGACYGGAVGIAVQCDLRIAREDAAIAIPAAKLGVSYDYAAIEKLVDLVGPAECASIFMTGQVLSAERAERIGLVNHVIAADAFDTHSATMLRRIADMAPLTLRSVKTAISIARDRKLDQDGRAAFDAAFRACFASADYAEGRLAFAEKRSPVFKGI